MLWARFYVHRTCMPPFAAPTHVPQCYAASQGDQPHCGFPEAAYHQMAETLARAGKKVSVGLCACACVGSWGGGCAVWVCAQTHHREGYHQMAETLARAGKKVCVVRSCWDWGCWLFASSVELLALVVCS